MNPKYKVFTSEIKAFDEKNGTMVASISTDTVDRMGEVLDPKGVDLTNYKKNPVVLWAHDYSVPPIAKALWVKRDGNSGVISKMEFAKTAFAQEIFQLYVGGFMKAFSVGFIPKDYVEGDGKKSPRLTFTQWEMLEYSAVPVPANPDALALAIKKGYKISPETQKFLDSAVPVEDENWGGMLKDGDLPLIEHKEVIVERKDGLEELVAENNLLKEKIGGLDSQILKLSDENSDLRYKVYQLNNKKEISEIAGKNVFDSIDDIIFRAIRKAQGKVN